MPRLLQLVLHAEDCTTVHEVLMREATFIELRNSAKEFFDAVEAGDTVRVFRNGKPIAEIVPVRSTLPSWKRPAMPVTIKGVSLSHEIRIDRNKSA